MLFFVKYAFINFRSPNQYTISIDLLSIRISIRQAYGSASKGIEGIRIKLYQKVCLVLYVHIWYYPLDVASGLNHFHHDTCAAFSKASAREGLTSEFVFKSLGLLFFPGAFRNLSFSYVRRTQHVMVSFKNIINKYENYSRSFSTSVCSLVTIIM